jgi:hypothetical protein
MQAGAQASMYIHFRKTRTEPGDLDALELVPAQFRLM